MNIYIHLASPRWFCAGVTRAIDILNKALKEFSSPLYVNHEIIHNKYIIDFFKNKGVIFQDDLEKIPAESIMIFSAHGVGPKFIKRVREKQIQFIDASCPLVIKVHKEALDFIKKEYKIIYIGSKKHQEALGVKEESPDNISIISNRSDLEALAFDPSDNLALLTQTTLSIDDTKELIAHTKQKYPQIILPKASDICYATTNRQNAVKTLCEDIDLLIIVGSKNSSNSTKLKNIGEKKWITSLLIDSFHEIDPNLLYDSIKIGVSSGASVPDSLVQEVIEFLKSKWGSIKKEIVEAKEKIDFWSEMVLQK